MNEYTIASEQMRQLLVEWGKKHERSSGFVQRESKLGGAEFVGITVLGWLGNAESSLNELVQVGADMGLTISESGLHQRFNEGAVQLLEAVLHEMLAQVQLPDQQSVLGAWTALYLVDSTCICLPSTLQDYFQGFKSAGTEAVVKVQVCLDYQRGQVRALELTDGCEVDQSSSLIGEVLEAGACYIFDLGYFNQKTFQAIAQAQGYFVSRLKFGTYCYAQPSSPTPIDWTTWLRTTDHQEWTQAVCLGANTRLPVRVIATRLPPEVAAERRRKAYAQARKKGETPSEAYLAWLDWSWFITNCPPDTLSASTVLTYYRLRWQIELLFKLWKSHMHLAHIAGYSPARVLVQFYARLVGLLLFQQLCIPYRHRFGRELSLTKAFHCFQRYVPHFRLALPSPSHLVTLLQRWSTDLARFALQNKRRKHPSAADQLAFLWSSA